jgi:hypothetical protein
VTTGTPSDLPPDLEAACSALPKEHAFSENEASANAMKKYADMGMR